MVPDCCLSYLDLMDLGRLLLTSHHLYKVAGAFISVLQADITRGQSLLHSPLPCFPPSSSLGVSPLPFLPSGFEWIDAVVMPPGTQNRRLLPVKRRKEEEAKGEEEEGEEEEEEEGEIACVRDGGLLPRLCLFTSREVKVGEELTFAYGEGRSEGQRVCRCGARECQGFLPCYPGL
ncbi:histone-lysine n-methyltransferase setmar-like [Nannochloropsis oceanica]